MGFLWGPECSTVMLLKMSNTPARRQAEFSQVFENVHFILFELTPRVSNNRNQLTIDAAGLRALKARLLLRLIRSHKIRFLPLLVTLALVFTTAGCGLFSEPNSDAPFTFPGVDDDSGDGGSGSGTDLCANVTCPTGQECNKSDGSCNVSTPAPDCSSDSDCPDDSNGDNQICESDVCQVGCRVNEDCADGETCNTSSNSCVVNSCPTPPTCTASQTIDLVKCECVNIPTDTCKVVWQAGLKSPDNVGLKLYIDAQFPAQDLPNACSTDNEVTEFGCVKNSGPEDDPALITECNKFSGDSKTDCLARTNVPLIPFATRDQDPINLYFVPDNASDPNAGGKIFIKASEFPDYLIYNTSEDLQANLAVDAGHGELIAPGIQIPEIVGQGDYSVDESGRVSVTALPLHFRAINLIKFPFTDHTAPPPAIFDAYVSDFTDPGFNLEDPLIKMSGVTCSTTGLQGVSVLPPLEGLPLTFTTGTNSDAQPHASIADSSGTITFTGCPIAPASECDCTMDPDGDVDSPACGTNPGSNPNQPWLRLVTGLSIPTETCLAGLQGAALGAEIEGPVENADGTPFVDLATACAKTGSSGGNNGGGSGDLNISVDLDGEDLPLTEGDANVFTAEVDLADEPFYKEEVDAGITDINVLARFETIISLTITNDGTPSDAAPVFDISSDNTAFEIAAAGLLNGTSLNSGESKNIQVRFAPTDPKPSGCVDNDIDPTKWDCTAEIDIFEGGSLTITVTGTARPPAADVKVTEVGAIQGETYNLPVMPELIPGDGEVAYGTTPVGTPVIKAYEISNSGVRDLTVTSVQSNDLTFNFMKGATLQGESLEDALFSFSPMPATVSTDGSDKLYFYEVYWPSGNLPTEPDDCEGKPCRQDAASVLIQTDAGNRLLSLSGAMTLDLAARLEVYIEDPVLLDAGITDNPHLIDCSGILPSNVICVEGNTKAAVRVDPVEGYTAFRSDTSTRGVYLVNGNAALLADALRVTNGNITFAGGVDAAQWNATIPEPTLFDSGCLILNPGEALKIGDIAYITDGGATSRTLHSATLDVTGDAINQGGTCESAANEPLVLNGSLQGVSGAPNGGANLHVLRMVGGINTALPDGTKMTSTVTPGQRDRASLSGFDTFKLPVTFDAANGIITLDPVFTPLPPAFTGGTGQMRLFNPTASGPGSGGQWLFRDDCQSSPGAGCSEFYLYIAKDQTSFESSAPAPSIYTNYSSSDALSIIAKNPESVDFSSDADFEEALGVYDPAGGKIQFTNNVAIRLFMHPKTDLTDRVDSAMVGTLSTECLADAEGNVLVAEPGLSAAIPAALLTTQVFGATELDAGGSNKNTIFGDNPLKQHMDTMPDCAAGANVMRGRRMGIPAVDSVPDTNTTTHLDSNSVPSGLTFDLAGAFRLKHNSPQLAAPRDMYVIIKACVPQGGAGSCNIN